MAFKLFRARPRARRAVMLSGKGRMFSKIRTLFFVILFSVLLINTLVIIKNDGFNDGVQYLGEKLFFRTATLADESLRIIDQGGIVVEDSNFFSAVGQIAAASWELITALVIIYFWLWVLMKILLWQPLADTSKQPVAWMFSFFIFFLIQIAYVGRYRTDVGLLYPLEAFWYFLKAIPYFVKPLAPLAEKVIAGDMTDMLGDTFSNVGNLTNSSI